LLKDQWVIDEIKEEIKRFLEINENENMTYWNLWDTAKADLRGKFVAMSACIKRTERSQINDLMLHLKLLEKQEQANPKINRREIMKIRAEINEIETKKPHTNRIKNRELESLDKRPWCGKKLVNMLVDINRHSLHTNNDKNNHR
jgi:hypothetical protein